MLITNSKSWREPQLCCWSPTGIPQRHAQLHRRLVSFPVLTVTSSPPNLLQGLIICLYWGPMLYEAQPHPLHPGPLLLVTANLRLVLHGPSSPLQNYNQQSSDTRSPWASLRTLCIGVRTGVGLPEVFRGQT